jgi:hypothetical protein
VAGPPAQQPATPASTVEGVKTYHELLAEFHAASSRAEELRAEWADQLPTEGVRLTSHPALRRLSEQILAAEAEVAAARTALLDYRGEPAH